MSGMVASLGPHSAVTSGGCDKDLHLVLHKLLSVDRCRAPNFVFFKLGDLSYIPEAVCNTTEDEDFGAEISKQNLQQL